MTQADKRYSDRLREIAGEIASGPVGIVAIAGPSSSGKTTTAARLADALAERGVKAHPLSLDDYFVDRHLTPLAPDGSYDYESLYALRLDRLHSDLQRLMAGEEVALPAYDFLTGAAGESGKTLRMLPGEVLLIEGLHALNPELTGPLDAPLFCIYAAPGEAPEWDKSGLTSELLRLVRRMVRDSRTRGASAASTLHRWKSVRDGERRWIEPFVDRANARLDTRLDYEPGLLRPLAMERLRDLDEREADAKDGDITLSPEERDLADRAEKALTAWDGPAMQPEMVPRDSILREFIGV